MNTKSEKQHGSHPEIFLEIGQDWLKILRAERSRAGVRISHLVLEKLETSGAIAPERLSELLRQVGVTRGSVYAALPRQMVTVRILELPSTNSDEIADMVELQVGRQTPHAREEIVADYKIIGPGKQGYTRVMLAIVQRSVLRSRYSVIEEVGLRVERMTLGSEGLAHWFRYASGLKTSAGIMVVDVDSFFSEVAIYEGQRFVFTRSILVGANHLLADKEGALDRMVREIRSSMATYQSEGGGTTLDRMILTGAGMVEATCADALADALELKVECRDPMSGFKKLPATPDRGQPPHNALSLTAVAGMAYAPESLDFNLVPDSVRMRREITQKASRLSRMGVLVMLLLVIVSCAGMLRFAVRKSRLADVQAVAAEVRPAAKHVEDQRAVIRDLRRFTEPRKSAVNLLYTLHSQVPAESNIIFTRVEVDASGGRIQLAGTAPSTEAVRALVRSLDESEILTDVQESGETVIEGQTGRYRFSVVCMLEAALL